MSPGLLGTGRFLFRRWAEPRVPCRAWEIPRGVLVTVEGGQHLCSLLCLPHSFLPCPAWRGWDFRCGSGERRGALVLQLPLPLVPSDKHTGHTPPWSGDGVGTGMHGWARWAEASTAPGDLLAHATPRLPFSPRPISAPAPGEVTSPSQLQSGKRLGSQQRRLSQQQHQ